MTKEKFIAAVENILTPNGVVITRRGTFYVSTETMDSGLSFPDGIGVLEE